MQQDNRFLENKIGDGAIEYPNAHRAGKVYAQWMNGFVEEEIALFFDIPETEVKRDLQHVISRLSPRAIIQHNNDRSRILVQREQSDKYRSLLRKALDKNVEDWMATGISPVGVMREYREAVGMVQRPEGLTIAVNKNTANFNLGAGGAAGVPIRGVEDIIRGILAVNPDREISAPVDLPEDHLKAIDAASDADSPDDAPEFEDQTGDDDEDEE